jgi:hypothetical protein
MSVSAIQNEIAVLGAGLGEYPGQEAILAELSTAYQGTIISTRHTPSEYELMTAQHVIDRARLQLEALRASGGDAAARSQSAAEAVLVAVTRGTFYSSGAEAGVVGSGNILDSLTRFLERLGSVGAIVLVIVLLVIFARR